MVDLPFTIGKIMAFNAIGELPLREFYLCTTTWAGYYDCTRCLAYDDLEQRGESYCPGEMFI